MAQEKDLPGGEVNNKRIIADYQKEYMSVSTIAEKNKISRQTVYNVLKANKVKVASKIGVECSWCGDIVIKFRSQIRGRQDHFCNMDCRNEFLRVFHENSSHFPHRVSYNVIAQVFPGLSEEHSIHYEDRNTRNNMLRNLKVFKSFQDHLDFHRGCVVTPVWDGRGK